MRKIISILVAVGLLLSLSAMATPAGAQPPCATIVATNNCSGSTAQYTITYTSNVSIEPANDQISVEFPAGTTFGTFVTGDIVVNTFWNVDITKLVVTGTKLAFPWPAPYLPAGATVTIVINKVINGPAGTNNICLDYKLVCCPEVVWCCVPYTIIPAIETLGFHFDHSKTYVGLAEDFIPPFKACGQDGFGIYNATVGWMNVFDIILRADVPGCNPPCNNASMWFVLTACPAGETVTFIFDTLGTVGGPFSFTLTAANLTTKIPLPNVLMPAAPTNISWEANLHFSSPGEYELCFYVECPAVVCGPGSAIVAEGCMPVKVHQWKDAWKIPLYRKWNLISLPLVPLEDPPIADMLNAYIFKNDVISVWHYDACGTGAWEMWPGGGLTDLVDGKSYWVRIVYNSTHPAGMPADGLWVWGTPKPVPPNSPSSYEVCTGWNMVGFTDSTGSPVFPSGGIPDSSYLWNWWDILFTFPDYGTVCGWDPIAQQFWSFQPGFGWFWWLYLGEGYWISFEHDGFIYPP